MAHSIYDYPAIFRRVHMEEPGEIEAETAFMQAIWHRHLKRPVRRLLDVGCGDSPHGRLLIKQHIDVVGIDRSPVMIAAGRAASDGRIRFYRRGFERFRIPEGNFDAAILMSETFPVMSSNAALLGHLQSVGRTMRRGGIYCVDIDRHGGVEIIRGRRKLWRERSVRIGDIHVDIREFNRPITWDSGLHSIYQLACRIRFPDGREVTTNDNIPVRYIIPATLELAARASGYFNLIASYADLSLTRPMSRCYGRWWGVLRRV
jgi:SAM-dependent methyltransferase